MKRNRLLTEKRHLKTLQQSQPKMAAQHTATDGCSHRPISSSGAGAKVILNGPDACSWQSARPEQDGSFSCFQIWKKLNRRVGGDQNRMKSHLAGMAIVLAFAFSGCATTATMKYTTDSFGKVKTVEVVKSSGDPEIDKGLLSVFRDANERTAAFRLGGLPDPSRLPRNRTIYQKVKLSESE